MGKFNTLRIALERGVHWRCRDYAKPSQPNDLPRGNPGFACAHLGNGNACTEFASRRADKFTCEVSVANGGPLPKALQGNSKNKTGDESQGVCGDERRRVWVCVSRHARDDVARTGPDRTRSARASLHETSAACLLCDRRVARDRSKFYCVEIGALAKMAQVLVDSAGCLCIRKSLWLRDDEGERVMFSTLSPGQDIGADRLRNRGIQS